MAHFSQVSNPSDSAMLKGGIDMNSANMSMVIKRDGKGVPLPLNMQDMRMLNNIQGFIPKIREIRPVTNTPFFNHLQENIQA